MTNASSATNEATTRCCDRQSAFIARLLSSSFLPAHHRVAHQHRLECVTVAREHRAGPSGSADHDLVAVHSVLARDFCHSQELDVDRILTLERELIGAVIAPVLSRKARAVACRA